MDLPNNLKLLDCSLWDGGYYTNWDFEQDLVYSYLNNIKEQNGYLKNGGQDIFLNILNKNPK